MTGEPGQKAARFGEKGMRIVRAWETMLLLAESPIPLTAKEINDRIHSDPRFSDHQCSIQTTREDLKTLLKCRFPIGMIDEQGNEIDPDEVESTQGKFKNVRWHMRDPSRLGELRHPGHRQPTSADLVALSLCRALLDDVVPSQYPLYTSISRMLGELKIRLNQALRMGDPAVGDLYGKVRLLGRQYTGQSVPDESWDVITKAIAKRQVLLADYKNRDGESRKVDIAPLAVWFSDGRGYVLAAGATDEKVRAWRIDRFAGFSVEPKRKAPEVSEKVIEEALRNSFKGYISDPIQIRLKVKPEAAYLFREFQYHPSQVIVENADGSLDVTLKCAVGWGLEEWILGFGELVIVERPMVLRESLKVRINSTLKGYSD